jgi:hypothetical protein
MTSLDLPDLLDVVHSYQVDDQVPTVISPPDKDGNCAIFSRGRAKNEHQVSAVPKSIDDEDRETWGTAPEQQAAQRNLMASVGAPAGPPLPLTGP